MAADLMSNLAARPAASESAKRIRDAAQACLPRLKARIEQRRAEAGLVLPSSAPGEGQDELLRAAEHRSDGEPDTLLRPDETKNQ